MSNWQPGDLALCIKQRPWERLSPGKGAFPYAKCGTIYSVRRIFCEFDEEFLGFTEGHGLFRSCHFIKVTPSADIEGIEAENRRAVEVDA